jgi:electron transfer flavoprotein beta subunit
MVPGMLAAMLGVNFVNTCIDLQVDGSNVTAIREIDGGKETLTTSLPLVVGGQKGLVAESDLRIPNMRGIMMARKKPLHVKEATTSGSSSQTVKFEKPAPKGAVTMIDPENVDQLIDLLHNEAKVI